MKEQNTPEFGGSSKTEIYAQVLKLTQGCCGALLDIGAGQGNLTRLLFEQGHRQVYACDKEPQHFGAGAINCRRCDLNYESLPYADGFFDAAVCIEVIEHLENPRRLIREIHRVLKPKGRLVISAPNFLSLRSRLSFLFRGYSSYLKKMPSEEKSAHISAVTKLDFLAIFKETGFTPLEIVYTQGVIPKTSVHWRAILPFLKGQLFSDDIIILAEKEGNQPTATPD